MNIIIPLSSLPSRNNDIELKFTLRSLPPHDKVYVIGRNPKLPGIIHVPFEDEPGLQHKSKNIYNKILHAFTFLDQFYFHSDDHFILNDFDYACYYEGTLEDHLQPATAEDYKVTIKNTIAYLRERKLPTKFFNVHCPIYYEKKKFPVLDQHPPYGYCIKSIYCNVNKIQGVLYTDYKIRSLMSKKEILNKVSGRKFFSSDDRFINLPFVYALTELYPEPSRYEKDCISTVF